MVRMRRARDKVVRRWRNSALSKGLAGWKRGAGLLAQVRAASRRVVLRWTKGAIMGPAFSRMQEHCAERQRMREALGKALGRMMSLRLSTALHGWIAGMEYQRRLAKQQQVIGRTVYRMRQLALCAGWAGWVDATRRLARVKRVARLSLQRMRNVVAGAALDAWREGAKAHRRLARVAMSLLRPGESI